MNLAKMWNDTAKRTIEKKNGVEENLKTYNDYDDVPDEKRMEEIKKAVEENYRFFLRGNTYPVKEIIKKAGCKWHPVYKQWYTIDYFWRNTALKHATTEEEKDMIKKITVEFALY